MGHRGVWMWRRECEGMSRSGRPPVVPSAKPQLARLQESGLEARGRGWDVDPIDVGTHRDTHLHTQGGGHTLLKHQCSYLGTHLQKCEGVPKAVSNKSSCSLYAALCSLKCVLCGPFVRISSINVKDVIYITCVSPSSLNLNSTSQKIRVCNHQSLSFPLVLFPSFSWSELWPFVCNCILLLPLPELTNPRANTHMSCRCDWCRNSQQSHRKKVESLNRDHSIKSPSANHTHATLTNSYFFLYYKHCQKRFDNDDSPVCLANVVSPQVMWVSIFFCGCYTEITNITLAADRTVKDGSIQKLYPT